MTVLPWMGRGFAIGSEKRQQDAGATSRDSNFCDF
jgi:hypothetical protein